MLRKKKIKPEEAAEPAKQQTRRPTAWVLSPNVMLRLVLVPVTLYFLNHLFSPIAKSLRSDQNRTLAAVSDVVGKSFYTLPCSDDYKTDLTRFPLCVPRSCGRLVTDTQVSAEVTDTLYHLARDVIAQGGSSGGASIFDISSGALSHGDKFVSFYSLPIARTILTEKQLAAYLQIRQTAARLVSEEFQVPPESLYLTKPSFFSRMTAKSAKSLHDEYWHSHVDKTTYGSFVYTGLVYLSDFSTHFTGGRFVFVDSPQNRTVEPRRGRLMLFTSGSENTHFVEPVRSGTRYALTLAFTCDPAFAIADPELPW